MTNDILVGGEREEKNRFIKNLSCVYKLATIVHMPGTFNFFGLVVSQDSDSYVTIHADQKLSELEPYSFPRVRGKQIDSLLNSYENHLF